MVGDPNDPSSPGRSILLFCLAQSCGAWTPRNGPLRRSNFWAAASPVPGAAILSGAVSEMAENLWSNARKCASPIRTDGSARNRVLVRCLPARRASELRTLRDDAGCYTLLADTSGVRIPHGYDLPYAHRLRGGRL